MSEDQFREATKVMRRIASYLKGLVDWEWEEEVIRPGRRKLPNGTEYHFYYVFAMKPKGIPEEEGWFDAIFWMASSGEKNESISMSTKPIFWGCYWTAYYYPRRVEEKLKRAWEIAECWRRKANEMFGTRLILPDEAALLKCCFNMKRVYPKLVRQHFKAMKYAFFGARRQLKEEGIMITEKILDLELKLEDGLEVTEEDIKAALGEG